MNVETVIEFATNWKEGQFDGYSLAVKSTIKSEIACDEEESVVNSCAQIWRQLFQGIDKDIMSQIDFPAYFKNAMNGHLVATSLFFGLSEHTMLMVKNNLYGTNNFFFLLHIYQRASH